MKKITLSFAVLLFFISMKSEGKDFNMHIVKSDYSRLSVSGYSYNDKFKGFSYNIKQIKRRTDTSYPFLKVTYDYTFSYGEKIKYYTTTGSFIETTLSKEEIIKGLRIGMVDSYYFLPFGLNSTVGSGGINAVCYLFSKQKDTIEFFIINIVTSDLNSKFSIEERFEKNIVIPSVLRAYQIFYAKLKYSDLTVVR